MAGTERDGPFDDDAGAFDDSDGESDTIDTLDVDDAGQAAQADAGDVDVEDDQGSGGGLLSRFRGGGEADVDEADQEDVDEDGGGLLASVRERFQDDEEPGEPTRAELVDGAQVLFIDAAAKRKSLYEYDLVLITAPAYPEPIVLKNDVPIEIPEGSVLCTASSTTMINYGGKRLLAKANILVPPDRADEVDPDYREDVPEAVVGKTIPQRPVQDEDFYQLVLNGCAASSAE
jgi:hypothetical protein